MSETSINGCETAPPQQSSADENNKIENSMVTADDTSIYSDKAYYENAKKYWASIKPNDDGMLGGLSCVNIVDIQFSKQFLQHVLKTKPAPGKNYACDCGAGIGRITKNLLVQFFDKVDLVEQDEQFCLKAKATLEKSGSIGQVYNQGLQEFEPEHEKYDVIWCQWVLGHLKDDHLVYFFRRAIQGLKKNGMIIVKENITSSKHVEFDSKDSSVARPLALMKKLISEAGLRIIRDVRQTNFPKGLYPVYMFALRPQLTNK